MQCTTEDPIPFPPDPIDDGAMTHSKTTASNTQIHADNHPIKRAFSQKYLSIASTHTNHSESSSASNSTPGSFINRTPQQQILNQTDTVQTPSISICPTSSHSTALSTTEDANEDNIMEETLTVCHLADDESLNKEYRVKLYQLSNDGNWKDEGTGIIQFKLCRDEMSMKSIEIRIISEEDKHKILLQHTALSHILYDKQGDSIIQWLDGRDAKTQIERAISFQHKLRCLEVWRLIAFMKGFTKLSQFEAETRKHKNEDEDIRDAKSKASNSPNVEFESDHNNNNNKKKKNKEEEDDDVEMSEVETDTDINTERVSKNSDSNGLLLTFLNDHKDDDNDDKEEEHETTDSDNDNDIDINIEDNNKTQTLTLKHKEKKLKKKQKKKHKKKKKKESSEMQEDESESDDCDCSENDDGSNAIDDSSDDEEDDGGTEFLHKLTMRTRKTAYKKKVDIPQPTAHNLCEVYLKVRNAIEHKDISALNELASIQWRDALYSVFLSIEREQENKCISQQSCDTCIDIIPKLEKVNDEEDSTKYHALELIFKIVLECCRECQQIKLQKEKEKKKSPKSEFRLKIESIKQQQLGYIMHSSFAQLLSTGTFGHRQDRNDNYTLMMVFLGKEFISKSIAMLEYDPIRRTKHENIMLSYKHRSFLNNATPKRLNDDIEMIDSDELYEEIEYVYKLNYARDCVLLGKLDLEQQAFHILNHHIARYNTVICETIVEDSTFLHTLFKKIKQSCSNNNKNIYFLSEYLCRVKCINDPQIRSAIFIELIQNGLLDTLNSCVSASHVLPTKEFGFIWLVLVECLHHMISTTPCGNSAQVRTYIVQQIEDNNCKQTLLQRLCSVFSSQYICSEEAPGILDQIYYVIVSLLGLDDLMGLDAAQALSFIGFGDRDLRTKRLKVISAHFFDECVPLFYRILSASNRYISNISNDTNIYHQIKSIQKHVINLLSACCEQEQFVPKLKELEEKYDLMSSVHNLIYVPKDIDCKTIPNKDLSMCCIRFLRECLHLAQHDKFWSNRIKNYGLFKNILSIFDCNGLKTYNMMNSTILSIFASIEDKKIEDIIVYLGDEKILAKYSKLINYTTKFDDLIELYHKAKQGIPIQSQIDEQSTVSLSNCSSVSPRISPSGLSPAIMTANNGWNNSLSKEEIHYFEDNDNDQHDNGEKYILDDGEKYKNGHPIYKDSPRPNNAALMRHKMRTKELKLPNRETNDEDSFDLLSNANANAMRQKQQQHKKKFNLAIGRRKIASQEKNGETGKEISPFLLAVTNAMQEEALATKGTKRKYADICNGSKEEDINHNSASASFEFGHYLKNAHDESPPKKKIKLMNGNHLKHSDNNHCINKNKVMSPKTSILLNSKTHEKHNKHVHFEAGNNTKDIAMHSNKHHQILNKECILHSEIIKNNNNNNNISAAT